MSGTSYVFIQKRKEKEQREALSQKMFDFGQVLEHGPKTVFHDVETLPHPKQEILGGFLNAIANAKTRNEVDIYTACALRLSYYLDGVGPTQGISLLDDAMDLEALPFDEFCALATAEIPKLQKFQAASSVNLEFISSCADAAWAMNPHLHSPLKKAWEKLRGRGFRSRLSDGFINASGEILGI